MIDGIFDHKQIGAFEISFFQSFTAVVNGQICANKNIRAIFPQPF